jgi:hypothetical protein
MALPDQTKDRLARAAARRHTTEAELIREAVERLLRNEPPTSQPPGQPRLNTSSRSVPANDSA